MKPLKRVVLKEELVVLTGDYKKAILLNQFIYWSERVADFDKFIAEEKERCSKNDMENNQEFLNGWMYKSAEDLSDETMLGLSKSNMGAHIKYLVDNDWLSERNNPVFKWDRTKQYRVNIVKIQQDLFELGYALEGYPLITDFADEEYIIPSSKTEHAENTEKTVMNNKKEETEPRSFKTKHASSKIEHGGSKTKPRSTRNETAIPEITTEITTDIYNQSVSQNINSNIDRQTDEELKAKLILNYAIKYIHLYPIPLPEKNMITQALENIIMSDKPIRDHMQCERLKNINKILNDRVINYALEKFKKLDKSTIKNPQGYFTSILYNSIFEIDAADTINKNQPIKQSKNKFHNFEQRTNEYSPEEFEEMRERNLASKLKKLGVEVKNNEPSS